MKEVQRRASVTSRQTELSGQNPKTERSQALTAGIEVVVEQCKTRNSAFKRDTPPSVTQAAKINKPQNNEVATREASCK